jgi:hypothetical protein
MWSLAVIKMAVQFGTILGYDVVVWILDHGVSVGAYCDEYPEVRDIGSSIVH